MPNYKDMLAMKDQGGWKGSFWKLEKESVVFVLFVFDYGFLNWLGWI